MIQVNKENSVKLDGSCAMLLNAKEMVQRTCSVGRAQGTTCRRCV